MREIKFRAWHKKYEYMARVADIHFNRERINLNAADIGSFDQIELMQYTGLKDKNGVEIYEGDIVTKYGRKAQVVGGYHNCGCCHDVYGFTLLDKDGCVTDEISFCNCEVIGNIYENPELLEDVCKD